MSSEIRSVIFDWGGVLIKNPVQDMIRFFCRKFDSDPEQLLAAYAPFQTDFERGVLPESELWKEIARALNSKIPQGDHLWRDAFYEAYELNEPVLNLVKQLQKSGYKTALLSNTEVPTSKIYPSLKYNTFDAVVFSCEVNMAKPQAEIYLHTLERLNSKAEQSIFIDDKIENVSAANHLGMHGILFTGFETLVRHLKNLSVTI